MRYAKSGSVTQALVDSDQFHDGSYTCKNEYTGSKISGEELVAGFDLGRSGKIEKQGFGGFYRLERESSGFFGAGAISFVQFEAIKFDGTFGDL